MPLPRRHWRALPIVWMAHTAERPRPVLVKNEFLVALHLEQLPEELGLEVAGVAGRVGQAITIQTDALALGR